MVVNPTKTELIYSSRSKQTQSLTICNGSITSTSTIKALGVQLSSDLSWSTHVDKAINRSRHLINRFKYLRKWLTRDDLLRLATSQYFSIIFYASPLWIGSLRSQSWKRLNSAHYCCLRATLGDYKASISRPELDRITKRATPLEWAKYAIASTIIKLYNRSDTDIANLIKASAYVNDRVPLRAKFIDNSRLKIGKQSIMNRIGPIFAAIDFDWIGNLSDDFIRTKLKKCFFKYFDA